MRENTFSTHCRKIQMPFAPTPARMLDKRGQQSAFPRICRFGLRHSRSRFTTSAHLSDFGTRRLGFGGHSATGPTYNRWTIENAMLYPNARRAIAGTDVWSHMGTLGRDLAPGTTFAREVPRRQTTYGTGRLVCCGHRTDLWDTRMAKRECRVDRGSIPNSQSRTTRFPCTGRMCSTHHRIDRM